MKYEKTLFYILELIVLFAVLALLNLWLNNEILASVLLLCFIAAAFWKRHEKGEWKLFVLGIIMGLVLELGTTYIFKLQYWAEGSIFHTPIWLYLIWGIGFVYIRRIGNSLIKKK